VPHKFPFTAHALSSIAIKAFMTFVLHTGIHYNWHYVNFSNTQLLP